MEGSALRKYWKKKKFCTGCGALKTVENTHVRRVSGTDYWSARCKKCSVQRTRAWRQKSPESVIFSGCKSRARRQGLPYDLSIEDIVIPEVCPVLGIPILTGQNKRTDNSPTIDRVVPSDGYVRDNIAVISWRANRLKNDATPEESRKIADFVTEFLAKRGKK